MSREPNFIDKLAPDKKSHVVLGVIVNPIIYAITFLRADYIGYDLQKASWFALLFCAIAHACLEIYQHYSKTGKGEVLDAVAGFSSAIICIQPVVLLVFNLIK